MKILFVACKYDYGKPELGFSFEYYNLYDSLVKMNNGVHQVVLFPFDQVALELGKDAMNEKLLEAVEKEKPILCFFFLFGDQIKKETIKKITDSGKTITFNWFADDKWRFENFSRNWAPLFNWVSTDQESSLKDYRRVGYNNVLVGGWACNDSLYKPLNLPKIYDVSFVGQPHGDRKKIVDVLQKYGIKVECFGRGWPNGKVSQEDMIKIFNQSKINLNFTKCSGALSLKYIANIFIKKSENGFIKINMISQWLPNCKSLLARQQNEIKGRNFEIPGCRAFMISGEARGLENYYKIGKELICFSNTKDLVQKIKYYLHNELEREEIANAAYKRTMESYTYEKKFNEIFKTIGLY